MVQVSLHDHCTAIHQPPFIILRCVIPIVLSQQYSVQCIYTYIYICSQKHNLSRGITM